jgi:periplasmic protein TonB
MKLLNRYQGRLGLALLASALLNFSLLAALSASFRPVSPEGPAPSAYRNLAVAFLPAAGESPADESAEAPRDTARTEEPEESLKENQEKSPPLSSESRDAAAETALRSESAAGGPVPPHEASRRVDEAAGLSGPAAGSIGLNPSEDEFLILLQELISENLVYPRRARQRGIEGTVILELVIDAEGMLRSRRIERESGSSMLDRAALALLDSVFPVSVKPGYDLDCSVSVSYRLN